MLLSRVRRRGRQSGYMLLFLMLAVAMITITLLSVAPNYRRAIQRDREVEMIHRGVQYERAVRLYYKKFNNQYPTSIDQLENTNKVRFLRRRYKDPMTPDGQWQIAHIQDIKLTGITSLTAAAGGTPTASPAGQPAGFLGNSATNPAATNPSGANPTGAASDSTAGSPSGSTPAAGDQPTGKPSGPSDTGTSGFGNVLGGGAMLGVISKSKAQGIHAFNDKSRYNEWYFIYDPGQDKGQLLNGPYNPKLMLTAGASTTGQPGKTSPGAPTPAPAPPTFGPGGTMPPRGANP